MVIALRQCGSLNPGVAGRFGESATFGETLDQATPVPDRRGAAKAESLVDPVGRQSGEVAGGQFNYPIILTPGAMHLNQKARGDNAKSQIVEAPGGLGPNGVSRETTEIGAFEFRGCDRASSPS
jgi:hypothetical protein